MNRQPWIRAALLVGVAYVVIGRLFPVPADHVRVWRLAAWVVSAVAFAGHIAYEHVRLQNPPRLIAFHTALAVAIGGFGLAVAGMLRSLASVSAVSPKWLLALVAWPAVTAAPAFVCALVAATLLARFPRNEGTAANRVH
jgi:hypothetical protein